MNSEMHAYFAKYWTVTLSKSLIMLSITHLCGPIRLHFRHVRGAKITFWHLPPVQAIEFLNFNPNVEIITDILLEDVQIAMRVFKIIKFYRIKILRGHYIGDTYSRWVTNRQTDIQTFRCTDIHNGHVGSYI